eukprot:g26070.t1
MNDHGKVLIVIHDMLKAVKNMVYFLRSGEVLDNEGYTIGLILCLSSEEVIVVFPCGTLELTNDELSIVSCSYEGIFQNLQVSSSSEQILCMR